MGNKCSDLKQDSDACDLYKCISKIKGLNSNSASVSDTMFLTFKDGSNYEGIPLRKGFLKYWLFRTEQDKIKNKYEIGLDYELGIYRDIIRPLVDYNICPNFIRYIASGKECDIDSVLNIVKTTISDENTADMVVERNIHYLLNNEPDRPSISDPYETWVPYQKIRMKNYKNVKVNFLVTETIQTGSMDLFDFVENGYDVGELLQCMFQVAAGCYAMSLAKMTHNDMHLGNILLQKIPKTTVTYIINNIVHTFETTIKVKIFDFDRSYADSMGKNSFLKYFSLTEQGLNNNYSDNKDIIKFLGLLLEHMDNSARPKISHIEYAKLKNNIVNYIAPDESLGYLENILEEGPLLFLGGSPIDDVHLSKFYSTQEILENISMDMDMSNTPTDIDENVFICDPRMFGENGNILI